MREAVPANRGLTAAEAVAGSLVTAIASAALTAYFLDFVGASIAPAAVLLVTLTCGAVTLYWWWPAPSSSRSSIFDLLLFASVVVAVLTLLLWLSWPDLLPPGGGSDLTHHLQLVEFIDRHWRLAHTAADATLIGNMVNYTPGFHLLASLAGAWSRTDGLHASYVVIAASVAIKTGIVFLIARRLLRPQADASVSSRADDAGALAIAAVLLVFLPDDYFLGSFARFSFLAQVVSETFAVAMWMALAVWRDRPSSAAMALFAIAGVGAFLSWPVWVGPPVVVLAMLTVFGRHVDLRTRVRQAAYALAPIAIVAMVHASGRAESVAIVQSGGAAFLPEVARFGWPFIVLASAGGMRSFIDRRAAVTALLLVAVVVQTAALFFVASVGHADSPYLALKMVHFGIYPMAVAGALALDWIVRALRNAVAARWQTSVVVPAVVWLTVLAAGVAVVKRFTAVKRPEPAITEDMFRAGQFARSHVQPDCIEYLVSQDSTSYWLYLAVLGNPSQPSSGTLPPIFVYREALIRWITGTSYSVTIADLSIVPREVRDGVDELARFGHIMVGRRRGTSGCPSLR